MRNPYYLALCLAAFGSAASAALLDSAPGGGSAPAVARDVEIHYGTVAFKADDGTALKADWWAPKGSDRAPAALLLHAAGADRTQLRDLAERLYKNGYGVLALDLRGHGESIAKPEDAYTLLENDEARANAWAFTTRDVEAAARWLRTNRAVHSANLNLFGVGAGSALAVRQGSRDENVRSVTLISPREKILGFDLHEDLLALEGVPTFLIASREGKQAVEALAKSVHDELGGAPFITVETLKAKTPADLLDDSKLEFTITKPLKAIAFPSRGRR